jgi:anthranilate synthase component 1
MVTFERFRELARHGTLVPVWRDVLVDTDTAVSAFAKIRRPPFAFLLESAPAGSETWSRYTFMGTEPRGAWRLRDGRVDSWTPAGGWVPGPPCEDPIADLQRRVRAEKPALVPELGAFWSGAVGYFAYDVVRTLERLPSPPPRGIDAPDALFVFTRSLLILDNLRGLGRIVVAVTVEDGTSESELLARFEQAQIEIEVLVERLRTPSPLRPLALADSAAPAIGDRRERRSSLPTCAESRIHRGGVASSACSPAGSNCPRFRQRRSLSRSGLNRRTCTTLRLDGVEGGQFAGAAGACGRRPRHRPADRRHAPSRRDTRRR